VLTALNSFIIWCLKLVVLSLRGYRSRGYFSTRYRDFSATLNSVAFQRTEIFTFQTIWVVADINNTQYQLAGILIRLFYYYRILSCYKIVLTSLFLSADSDKTHNSKKHDEWNEGDTLAFRPIIWQYRDP